MEHEEPIMAALKFCDSGAISCEISAISLDLVLWTKMRPGFACAIAVESCVIKILGETRAETILR